MCVVCQVSEERVLDHQFAASPITRKKRFANRGYPSGVREPFPLALAPAASVSGGQVGAVRDAFCHAAADTAIEVSPAAPRWVASTGIRRTSRRAHGQRTALDSRRSIRGRRGKREGRSNHGCVTEGINSQPFERQRK